MKVRKLDLTMYDATVEQFYIHNSRESIVLSNWFGEKL